MIDNNVSAFFHGHDHQYGYELRDGIVYQEVPSAGFAGSGFNFYTTGSGYCIKASNSPGHLGTTDPAAGTHTYDEGTLVTITAAPAAGYAFDHWSGACTGSGTCSVTMNADQTFTANFTVSVDDVAISKSGDYLKLDWTHQAASVAR